MAKVKKVRTRGFTQVDNRVVDDPNMSLAGLGLYTYMWRQPDDWDYYVTEIAKHFKNGRRSVDSAMHELIDLGYVKRERRRDNGQFKGYEYTLFDHPQPNCQNGETVSPNCCFANSENANSRFSTLPITNLTNTNLTNDWLNDINLNLLTEKESETEQQWGRLSTRTKESLDGLAKQFGQQIVVDGLMSFNGNGQHKSGLIKYVKKYIKSQQTEKTPLKLSASLVKLQRRQQTDGTYKVHVNESGRRHL